MKRVLPFISIFFVFTVSFSVNLYAQDLSGIWRGYFITDSREQYKFELQIDQNRANVISGVSYSYLSTIFYGKAQLTGMLKPSGNNVLIQEIKTLELRMSSSSVACIMKCNFQYIRSGREEFLEGFFTSKYEKTDTAYGIVRGRDCGGGTIYLRRVTTSDFYLEPFLRNRDLTKTDPPVYTPTKPKIAPNIADRKTPPAIQKKVEPKISQPEKKEETNIALPPIKLNDPDLPVIKERLTEKIPDQIRTRENPVTKTIYVDTDEITVKLYDNGEIDGDSISVYLDNKIVLYKKMLTASPLIVKLKMDENNTERELVMVAENLGRIPPNTSLMIVNAGDKRYEVRITSTEQKNAVVRFIYRKPR
jgi:hypothetical protein